MNEKLGCLGSLAGLVGAAGLLMYMFGGTTTTKTLGVLVMIPSVAFVGIRIMGESSRR